MMVYPGETPIHHPHNNNNGRKTQETVFVINRNNQIVPESSFADTLSSEPSSYTVSDLQRSLESNTGDIIGRTTPDENEKIIQNILHIIQKPERRTF
ncbi:unnamed protein product [Adineta steineri]|uniref:Uncharacterized protein n=1 Tax=Adineta steineri TaxID=433720 RepID=A0A813ZK18_9BILA|nr:unnamed protein product [Adineta steineri]CAF1176339.1 unnamed protein product [Adineta steineri]